MSREFIHRNDAGHHLAEKSIPVEYDWPPGDFVAPGHTFPHDVGCLCEACVSRRRDQARAEKSIPVEYHEPKPIVTSWVETTIAKLSQGAKSHWQKCARGAYRGKRKARKAEARMCRLVRDGR